jgi:fructose-bisphosphate aldolase class II
LEYAKDTGFAMPGVNIVGSNSINACMEAAKSYGGPIMVTFSKGGGAYIAGKAADNTDDAASIAGCIAGAKHVREVAKLYGVPVILHTDHCQKAWLPWIDGLLEANAEYYKEHGEPLFSSHMLDLSEEPLEENIGICKDYMEKFAKYDILLEFELGVTGGEEVRMGQGWSEATVSPPRPQTTNNILLVTSLLVSPNRTVSTTPTLTPPGSTPSPRR